MLAHYTAHARGNLVPLIDYDPCRWLWQRLRDAFPEALAVILMPDHLHLIAPYLARSRRRLAGTLAAFARVFGLGQLWESVPEPSLLTTRDKVVRGVRYVLLNGSRPWRHQGRWIQLVRDPLEWTWSTLRDTVGAIVDPWVPSERLARVLGKPLAGFGEALHRYVSSDPHVDVNGTPFPRRAPSTATPRIPLEAVADAAIACVRAMPEELRRRSPARRIFAALSFDQGWRQAALIAERCAVDPSNVHRLARSCPPEWLEAAALCLGDERLVAAPRYRPGTLVTTSR